MDAQCVGFVREIYKEKLIIHFCTPLKVSTFVCNFLITRIFESAFIGSCEHELFTYDENQPDSVLESLSSTVREVTL